MTAEADDPELQIEEENDEPPFVEFDISVSPADPTLELLANKVRDGDIIVPFYQRKGGVSKSCWREGVAGARAAA